MLVDADLSEQPIAGFLTWGESGDFDSSFWKTSGNAIVSTMIFNAYYPILEFLMYWAMRVLFRCLDRPLCSLDSYKTKKTSIKQYMDLYLGPVYYMHYKYSTVMNICFVTMMFGLGLPILFPIAIASFVILYLLEKTMLYYIYRMPPMYDERLSVSVIDKLRWAPCFFLAFGYWMVSSNQLFSNEYLYQVTKSDETRRTDHLEPSPFRRWGWDNIGWPLLFCFWSMLFFAIFGTWIRPLFEKMPCCKKDVQVTQVIDNYFKAVDHNQRDWSVEDEKHGREKLGNLRILSDRTYQKFKEEKSTEENNVQGVHTYDILANPNYVDSFQYVPCCTPNRAKYIIDDDSDEENDAAQSDIVRVALNLAYMLEEDAKAFVFDQKNFNTKMDGIKHKLLESLKSPGHMMPGQMMPG